MRSRLHAIPLCPAALILAAGSVVLVSQSLPSLRPASSSQRKQTASQLQQTTSQGQSTTSPRQPATPRRPTTQTPPVVPDLMERVAKFRRVSMPFRATGLTPREQQMVQKLVEASQQLENIFWRQSDPEALALFQSLAASTRPIDR